MMFQDRRDAGMRLAPLLAPYAHDNPIVLALPRGGVPVGFEIARALHAALDVWVVRKIGAPRQPELGLGAIAEGGVTVLDRDLMARVGASDEDVQRTIAHEQAELGRRVQLYRGGRAPPDLAGRVIILVDDGIATGGSMRAAIQTVARLAPRTLVVAVPVAAQDTVDALRPMVDDVVCVHVSAHFGSVGAWYVDFKQTTDAEVTHFLRLAQQGSAPQISEHI